MYAGEEIGRVNAKLKIEGKPLTFILRSLFYYNDRLDLVHAYNYLLSWLSLVLQASVFVLL